MVRTVAVVKDPKGIHARPSDILAKVANRFECNICLVSEDIDANAKKVVQVLSLGAAQGEEIVVEADGPDEREAVDALKTLIESDFEFPDRK